MSDLRPNQALADAMAEVEADFPDLAADPVRFRAALSDLVGDLTAEEAAIVDRRARENRAAQREAPDSSRRSWLLVVATVVAMVSVGLAAVSLARADRLSEEVAALESELGAARSAATVSADLATIRAALPDELDAVVEPVCLDERCPLSGRVRLRVTPDCPDRAKDCSLRVAIGSGAEASQRKPAGLGLHGERWIAGGPEPVDGRDAVFTCPGEPVPSEWVAVIVSAGARRVAGGARWRSVEGRVAVEVTTTEATSCWPEGVTQRFSMAY